MGLPNKHEPAAMSMRDEYAYNGYILIPSGLPEETLDAAKEASGPLQPMGYHSNDGPRIFEAWKTSQAVRDIVFCHEVIETIKFLYDLETEPRALQTINFRKGTDQPLHQDGIHFQTQPLGRMVGAWCALEDMDEKNGTLCYVPGSHRLGYQGWQDLGFVKTNVGCQFEQYRIYENWAEAKAFQMGGKKPLICKKGDVFIWGLDLFHGGYPIEDPSRTRYSQVSHYAFADAEFGWAPMFSDPEKGDYLRKTMRHFDREGKLHPWS